MPTALLRDGGVCICWHGYCHWHQTVKGDLIALLYSSHNALNCGECLFEPFCLAQRLSTWAVTARSSSQCMIPKVGFFLKLYFPYSFFQSTEEGRREGKVGGVGWGSKECTHNHASQECHKFRFGSLGPAMFRAQATAHGTTWGEVFSVCIPLAPFGVDYHGRKWAIANSEHPAVQRVINGVVL